MTTFEFALHPVGPEVFALDILYDLKVIKQILHKAQQFLAVAPDEAAIIERVSPLFP